MATQVTDPRTPESKPHGTTADQIKEMESEGSAQTPGQPTPDPDAPAPITDQDIDIAGTEADTQRSAAGDPTGRANNRNVEVPGDTDPADIVGPTGAQMPLQSHDGLEAESR